MRVGHREFIADNRAALQCDDDAAAKGLFLRVVAVIATRPLRVFHRGNLVPECDGLIAVGAFRRIGFLVVPAAVFERDGEDVHDGVIERFAAGLRVHLLRIIGASADHIMGVMAGVDDDALDLRQSADLRPHATRQINQRLALILGGMLLGVGVEDRALRLALFRQRHDVLRLRATQQIRDEAVFAFPGRRRRAFAAQHAVDGFDRHLACEGWRIGLPA